MVFHLPLSRILPPFALFIFFCCMFLPVPSGVSAQEVSPEVIAEAARRTGLGEEEIRRLYLQRQGTGAEAPAEVTGEEPPGRTDLEGIDDSRPAAPLVLLPFDLLPAAAETTRTQALAAPVTEAPAGPEYFGADFFRLEPGVFNPSTFGPVPEDYLIGVGDEIIVDVWGEVEFRLERIVDRDGSIILPKGGRISCFNRTLAEITRAVREKLSRSYSGISLQPGEGTTFLAVSLGRLRAIRVFVVGDVAQPGAYELSSVATVFTALYAAGGPSPTGSLREVRLMRGGDAVGSLDVYRYLLEGKREDENILREGDTVFVPRRGKTVKLQGEVRRPLVFELKENENLSDVLDFGGGFTTTAATEVVHVERILPPERRLAEQPDRICLDVRLDPATGRPLDGAAGVLLDGDVVTVGAIGDRLDNWVMVTGSVKRPGRYEFRAGMTAADLIAKAGGLWADTLMDRAVLDRTTAELDHLTLDFHLADVLGGRAEPVPLAPRDALTVFSRWDVEDRFEVAISGEIRRPGSYEFREGMALRDLILKAGGMKESADLLKAEVARVRLEALTSRDLETTQRRTVDFIEVPLDEEFLAAGQGFSLQRHDRVAIRKLPWWELARTVTLTGEVFYPGIYSLEGPGETLSAVITRAGGLKPTAFPDGARIVRTKDGVGNLALDLARALAKPGSEHDVILVPGDEIRIPEVPYTVKIIGAVGFPTSIVYEDGKSLGYYVSRAGGYAQNADKWKTRVVYPNGMSRPIRKIWRDPTVMAGSTIVVPVKPEKKAPGKLETLKDIAAILASAATIYLVIDRTGN